MRVRLECPLSAISELMHRRNCITKRGGRCNGQPQDTAGRNWLVSGVKGVTSTRYFPSPSSLQLSPSLRAVARGEVGSELPDSTRAAVKMALPSTTLDRYCA